MAFSLAWKLCLDGLLINIDERNLFMNGYSEYIVFVDESGGPTLKEIDPQYPLLVLAFMIVKKADYSKVLCPAVQAFKFAHFGHDQVILHERDIRRDSGVFTFLKSRERKEAFLNELTDIVAAAPFQLVAVVIRKDLLKARYAYPANPYHLALEYGLERVAAFLRQPSVWMEKSVAAFVKPDHVNTSVHVIFECRGKNEDDELELEFRRICDGNNFKSEKLNFEMVFSDKRSNSAGLQIADLVARPIGMSVLRPEQPNRAFAVLKEKFVQRSGRTDGWGLKVFP